MKHFLHRKSYSVNYLEGFWRDLAKQGLTQLRRLPIKRVGQIVLKSRQIDWKWALIAFLAGLLIARPASQSIIKEGETLPPVPKKISLVAQTSLSPVEPAQAAPVPQPVYVPPPASSPVVGCGSDPSMAFIYSHESGCNTASINASSGACGLGQALPCAKLPCSLSDWNCQNSYFVSYAVGRYGSTYAAMLFWEAHSWW